MKKAAPSGLGFRAGIAEGPGDDLRLDGVIDLGLDVGLARGWIVRVGAALGGRESLAVGARVPR